MPSAYPSFQGRGGGGDLRLHRFSGGLHESIWKERKKKKLPSFHDRKKTRQLCVAEPLRFEESRSKKKKKKKKTTEPRSIYSSGSRGGKRVSGTTGLPAGGKKRPALRGLSLRGGEEINAHYGTGKKGRREPPGVFTMRGEKKKRKKGRALNYLHRAGTQELWFLRKKGGEGVQEHGTLRIQKGGRRLSSAERRLRLPTEKEKNSARSGPRLRGKGRKNCPVSPPPGGRWNHP